MILRTSREIYAHIDCNCFFVSCECLRRPELRDAYVVVGGDMIIAASYSCRKLGIWVGTPIWKAESLLGNKLIKVRPDLSYYTQISRQFIAFLELHTLEVEVFSIDEAFVRITGIPELEYHGDGELWAEDMKQKIFKWIGIPVSIGISNTRIKAKILSDIHKPFGVCVGLDDETEQEIFKRLPIREIPFIGRWMQSRLGISIRTVEDFRNCSYFALDRLIGKNATTLWLELRGADVWKGSEQSMRTQKSLVRSRSFNHAMTDNKHYLWSRCIENFERAYRELILTESSISSVGVSLRAQDLSRSSRGFDFREFTDDRALILARLQECFEEVWQPGILYRTTGVVFGGMCLSTPRQLSFSYVSEVAHEHILQKPQEYTRNLERTLDAINIRYWKRTVRYGVSPDQTYTA